jgi:hypothetical protein
MFAPAVSGLADNSRSTNRHADFSTVELVVIGTYLSELVSKHIRGRAEDHCSENKFLNVDLSSDIRVKPSAPSQ